MINGILFEKIKDVKTNHHPGIELRGCQGISCSKVALYFTFFVLGKAANIEIFKDFTRAKKWRSTSQHEYLFLDNPLTDDDWFNFSGTNIVIFQKK